MSYYQLTPLSRFWRLLKPDRSEIRNVYIYAIFQGVIQLSLPIGIQAIINLIQGGALNSSWLLLAILVGVGIGIGGILQIGQLKITENLQQKVFTRAAFEFAFRMPRIKLEQLAGKYAPELMNRFFDVVSVQKALSKVLIDFSTAGIQVLFGLILLSLYHPFFIVFSLILVLLVVSILVFTAKRGLQTSLEESKEKYKIAHWLEELARTHHSFKLAGETDLPLKKMDGKVQKYISARERHFSVLVRQYIWMVIFKVAVALGLLIIGGLLVMNREMNVGQFVAAEIIILLVLASVEKLVLSFETIYDMLTALEKIGQVTDLELEEEQGIVPGNESKGMSLGMNELSFGFPVENGKVLKNISLYIRAGERVLVTGKNDSGKSTLLYLMGGLYSPISGSLTLDDIPLKNYHPAFLRAQIGSYLREEQLFEATLLENITLGREAVSFDHVKEIVEALGMKEFICSLPEGYDTLILPQGRQFSKSTVAKILLARAVAGYPRLLLLENSFSVFQPKERESILRYLFDRKHNWTLVITSPREDVPDEWLDQKITLNKGRIVN